MLIRSKDRMRSLRDRYYLPKPYAKQ
jgi:hypothetical protein